ncbi:MAG TPA: HU family DNA-binding protein [Spirochaetia bacterium]|nr:HU family DNA-binding protein [Spirochaetia bacterium]
MKYSEEYLEKVLTDRIKHHLRSITDTSGLPPGEKSLSDITANWLEKRRLFEDQIRLLGMELSDRFADGDQRGCILLTYSGSLVALGRRTEEGRWFEYASIKLRNDVPGLAKAEGVSIQGSIAVDAPACFLDCPIEHSSDVLLIAACPVNLQPAEEEKRLREATVFLTNGFVKINRTLTMPDDAIGHFTMKSMIQYLAKKHEISQVLAHHILDDYATMIEAGALMGESVPIGNIGRLRLARRPPQKARIGRNPATGREVTIPAKAEIFVPKISFSGRLKERASLMPIEEDT